MLKDLINKAYEKLENNQLVECVSICLRLARISNDYLNAAIFLKELSTDNKAYLETICSDMSHLNKEAQKFIYERTNDKWLKERSMSYKEIEPDEPKVLVASIGEIINDIKQKEASLLNDYITPSGMHPVNTGRVESENKRMRSIIRLTLGQMNIVVERIRTRCLNYLITLEKQILRQEEAKEIQIDFFNEVNNFFKGKDKEVYEKLLKCLELIKKEDDESHSLLLTEIRRSIEGVANYFYPPQDKEIKCSDGQIRKLSKDQYLNRLSEYIFNSLKKSTSSELLLLEFENIEHISRKLNELASKGVHSKVSKREAKQCLFSFYNFVSNLILLKQEDESGTND